MIMNREETISAIRLSLIPIAESKKAMLLQACDAADVFTANNDTLMSLGLTEKEIARFTQQDTLDTARKILCDCEKKNISVTALSSEAYPSVLKNISDPPVVLYHMGTLPDFDNVLSIGVVGQRKATDNGIKDAEVIGEDLGNAGVIVVSGGAAGIDTAALKGALKAHSPVVAVFGCGVDVDYPKTNWQLFRRIREHGCLISEYPPGTQPTKWSFPRRNRIISGLTGGIVVVEAPEKSGSLITANHALEQGRDVFCIPGPPKAAYCAGSNRLLKQGATLIEDAKDILACYQSQYAFDFIPAEKPQTVSVIPSRISETAMPGITQGKAGSEEETVLNILNYDGISVDEIAAKSAIPAGKVLSILTLLQIKGQIVSLPGGLFAKKNR